MGLTETSASAFKKMPGCLDGWPSHMLVLGLSTTSTTWWADIFRWLVSLVDDSAQPNGPQRGVRFLVHLFSVLAGGQCILGGALATYCLHTVLCEVGPDFYYCVRKMLPCVDSNISWKSSGNACGEELHCRLQLIDRTGSPTKHSSWWRRTEDVFSITFLCLSRRTSSRRNCKTSLWRCLEDLFKKTWRRHPGSKSWRRLEDVLRRRLEDILKTSWRRLWKTYCKHVLKASWKTKNYYAEDVFKTSWKSRDVCWGEAGYDK